MKADRGNYSVVLTRNYNKNDYIKYIYDKVHNRLFAFTMIDGKGSLRRDIKNSTDFTKAVQSVQKLFNLDNIIIDDNYQLNCWDYCYMIGTDITEKQMTEAIRYKCNGMLACSKITKFVMLTQMHCYNYQVVLTCDDCGKTFVEWREHNSGKMIDYRRETYCNECWEKKYGR